MSRYLVQTTEITQVLFSNCIQSDFVALRPRVDTWYMTWGACGETSINPFRRRAGEGLS